MNNTFEELKEAMEKYDSVLIAGHKNPDGDSIGSSIALGLALEGIGKKVTVYMKDLPPEYTVLKGRHLLSATPNEHYDLVIALDCADDTRFEIKTQFKNAKETINIDHHINNPNFATYNYVLEDASSTSEIIYSLLIKFGYTINRQIAEGIYTGIISDTGLFQNRNTRSETFDVVSELMKYEIDFNKIISNLFFRKTFTEMKLIGKAMDNIEQYNKGKLIISTLTLDEIKSVKAKSNETSNIISMIRQVEGTKIAIFIYEPIPKNVKVSLRCDIPYNVFEIASALGGGGHVLASGAIVKNKTMEEVKRQVIELANEQIERYEN